MTLRYIKDGALGADAVLSIVGVLVDEALLLHAERVYHLAHLLDRLRFDDPLSDLLLLCDSLLAPFTLLFLSW